MKFLLRQEHPLLLISLQVFRVSCKGERLLRQRVQFSQVWPWDRSEFFPSLAATEARYPGQQGTHWASQQDTFNTFVETCGHFFLTLTEPSLHLTSCDSGCLNSGPLQGSVQVKSCTGNEGWILQCACCPLSAPMHCQFLVLSSGKASDFVFSDMFLC